MYDLECYKTKSNEEVLKQEENELQLLKSSIIKVSRELKQLQNEHKHLSGSYYFNINIESMY
jgi:hypothetical protein